MRHRIEHSIPGPAGLLQVLEESGNGAVTHVAVVCHPHPLHGGTLHNKVVHQLARSFQALGAVTIRFNFRGVGDSGGQYDEGRGELDDLLTVVRWARRRWPDSGLWLSGFSFGAMIALTAAERVQPDWLVTVAPAINYLAPDAASPAGFPWLLIHGDQDDIVPTQQLLDWFALLASPPRLELVPGAGHFFHGRLNDLKLAINSAARELLPDIATVPGKLEDL